MPLYSPSDLLACAVYDGPFNKIVAVSGNSMQEIHAKASACPEGLGWEARQYIPIPDLERAKLVKRLEERDAKKQA